MKNRKLRVIISCLSFCCVLCTSCLNFEVFGETIFNIWSLLKIEDTTKHFSEEEISEITKNYMQIERNNLYAQIEREYAENEMNSDVDIERAELINNLENSRQSLVEAFVACKPVSDVFSEKTRFENLTVKLSSLRDNNYIVNFEYKDNIYEYDYKKVQEFEDNQYDIGVVGTGIQSPTSAGFILKRLQGSCVDWQDNTRLYYHTGIDLVANYGDDIYAQFNGIITKVYYSFTDGNVIELQSGSHLLTRYKHVGDVNCKVGDRVSQYSKIATVGSTGNRSDGPHVHIEMSVDNIMINPILLYGQMGRTALLKWIDENPNSFIDVRYLLDNIDVSRQHEETQKVYGYYEARPATNQAVVDDAVSKGLYPEGYSDTSIGFVDGGIPPEIAKLRDELQNIQKVGE